MTTIEPVRTTVGSRPSATSSEISPNTGKQLHNGTTWNSSLPAPPMNGSAGHVIDSSPHRSIDPSIHQSGIPVTHSAVRTLGQTGSVHSALLDALASLLPRFVVLPKHAAE